MLDLSPPLKNKLINAELCDLISAWQQTWLTIGLVKSPMGPRGDIPDRIKSGMSAESLAAEQPEETALENLIQYCVAAISIAHQNGTSNLVIDEINTIFTYSNRNARDFFKQQMQAEIFKRVLNNLQTNRTIAEIKMETGQHIGKALTFGFED